LARRQARWADGRGDAVAAGEITQQIKPVPPLLRVG